jgi:16S rRNA (guanine527-N7)-methyltransferase
MTPRPQGRSQSRSSGAPAGATVNNLRALLTEARDRGLLGDQAIERQLEHAKGFAAVCVAILEADHLRTPVPNSQAAREVPTRLLDLGTGGGLPGLVLACAQWPFETRTILLDGSARRAEWLQHAVDELDMNGSVDVLGERAEVAGRSPIWRHRQSVVVARSFGRPAVTAECAAPLLVGGGFLVVSEPPPWEATQGLEDGKEARSVPEGSVQLCERWPPPMVAELGFAAAVEWRAWGHRYSVLRAERLCPERYPRRNGIPAKRPLF